VERKQHGRKVTTSQHNLTPSQPHHTHHVDNQRVYKDHSLDLIAKVKVKGHEKGCPQSLSTATRHLSSRGTRTKAINSKSSTANTTSTIIIGFITQATRR
jgi:hypothetical protein